jgi:putative Mg2+ transporter-C (MgtC) family protein
MTWDELVVFPKWDQALQLVVRIAIAAILGGSIGFEREIKGKAAGIRTHMLVCMGTAIIILTARLDGIPIADMSRVIDGVVSGIGFLGGGVILKLSQEREIKGITTAAGIWATAAIGIAIGLGQVWIAIVSALVVLMILSVLGYTDKKLWGMDKDEA